MAIKKPKPLAKDVLNRELPVGTLVAIANGGNKNASRMDIGVIAESAGTKIKFIAVDSASQNIAEGKDPYLHTSYYPTPSYKAMIITEECLTDELRKAYNYLISMKDSWKVMSF